VSILHWLGQIPFADRAAVGEGAFYLSRLGEKGYPILPGFVVPARAFRGFLETIDWLEPLFTDFSTSSLHLDINNPRQLQAIAQQIRQVFQATELAADWLEALEGALQELRDQTTGEISALVLRPSIGLAHASDSFPSLQAQSLIEPRLCASHVSAVATMLKALWASAFRAQTLLYWQRSGIELQNIQLAVMVQPVQPAIASGFLEMSNQQLALQACWGHEWALLRGEVSPDCYWVEPGQGTTLYQPGWKPLAYGLETEIPQASPALEQWLPEPSPMMPYVLDAAYQTRMVLRDEVLEQIVQLGLRLHVAFGNTFRWTWVLGRAGREPRLCLSQVDAAIAPPEPVAGQARSLAIALPSPNAAEPKIKPASTPPVLQGIAAAPGQAIAPVHVITEAELLPSSAPAGTIWVAASIHPDWLPALRHAAGIIAEQGGRASHGAILARELGIPAVVGAAGALAAVRSGEVLLLDGDRGLVFRSPTPETSTDRLAQVTFPNGQRRPVADSGAPYPKPLPPTATQIWAAVSQVSSLERLRDQPVDGIGLLRSELMLVDLMAGRSLADWLQDPADVVARLAERIERFAAAIAPRPLFYRSLDLRAHEFPQFLGEGTSANPVLGQRGAYRYQVHPQLFELELAALGAVLARGLDNLRLLIPFVRSVEEFRFCRQRVEAAGLRRQGTFQLWIMAEVPSVLLLMADYVEAGVQGFSIGTNDLTQLLLGADRDDAALAQAYTAQHPAVRRAIAQILQTARQHRVPCAVCGQAVTDFPDLIAEWVQAGATALVVEPEAIAATQRALYQAEQQILLQWAQQQRHQESF